MCSSKATPYVSGDHLTKWDKGLHLAIARGLGILLFMITDAHRNAKVCQNLEPVSSHTHAGGSSGVRI